MLLRDHLRATLSIFGLTCAGSLAFYAYTTYMQKFLVNTAGYSKNAATGVTAGALVVYMLVQPLVGWASDHLGRRNVMAWGFALGAVATYPVFTLIARGGSAWAAFGLMTLLVLILSGYTAVNAAVKAELFPTHVRALGVALPYALANALFGGTAEYVALWFKQGGNESWFYIYVAGAMAIAAIISAKLPDTNAAELIHEA
jgi:MHS family alpha-ketoglutarate permease-like MFS transporter